MVGLSSPLFLTVGDLVFLSAVKIQASMELVGMDTKNCLCLKYRLLCDLGCNCFSEQEIALLVTNDTVKSGVS